jgi:hypothetical protein
MTTLRAGPGVQREGVGRVVSLSARLQGHVRADVHMLVQTRAGIRVDKLMSVRTHSRVPTITNVLPPGNFIMDTTVRPSQGRPSSHRPSVHSSVCYRPYDNPNHMHLQHVLYLS